MKKIEISKIYILGEEPTAAHNRFWFDTSTKLLKRYNGDTTSWESINVSSDDVKIDVNGEEQTLTSYLANTVDTALDSLESSKADSSSLATVATSGSYNDLTDKPTISDEVDLTGYATETYVDEAIEDISIPSKTSDLTNDSDYQTLSQVNSTLSSYSTTSNINTLLDTKTDNKYSISDTSSSTISVAIVGNTTYKYGTLTSLAFSSVEDSLYEAVIFFTAGSNFTTFTYPNNLYKIVEEITIESDKSYVIVISNNVMVVSELY